MLHEPSAVQRERVARPLSPRRAWAWLGCGLGGLGVAGSLLGCNVIVGGAAAVVLGGAGVLAAQCYDQVSVHVHDEAGIPMCNASVSVGQGDSFHSLRPCYHASLTSGTWRFAAQRDGYEPAQIELTVPERNGTCPHYTHSLELTLRHVGAPREAPFAPLKAAPTTAAPGTAAAPRQRPLLRLGPPVAPAAVAPGPVAPAPAVPPAPEPREAP